MQRLVSWLVAVGLVVTVVLSLWSPLSGPVAAEQNSIDLWTSVPDVVRVRTLSPTIILAVVSADFSRDAAGATWQSVEVVDDGGNVLGRLNLALPLTPLGSVFSNIQDVIDQVGEHGEKNPGLAGIFNASARLVELPLDMTRSRALRTGETRTLRVLNTYRRQRETLTTTTVTTLTVSGQVPQRPGWQAGEGHVHTATYSGSFGHTGTINTKTADAKNFGWGFVLFTDVNVSGSTFSSYKSEMATAESAYAIRVIPGQEVGTASGCGTGHALSYWSDRTTAIAGHVTGVRCHQALLNEINDVATYGTAYPVITHPFGGLYPWDDWANNEFTGFKAMELITGSRTAESAAIAKWFSLLRTQISQVIAGGSFTAGIATADQHFGNSWTWGEMTSFVYTGTSLPTSTDIWTAVAKGRVSASSDSTLGTFAVNNYAVGSVVPITSGTTLTFKIVGQSPTGRIVTRYDILDSNQRIVTTGFPYSSSFELFYDLTPTNASYPSGDTFFVVRFFTDNSAQTDLGEVWANPIFIDVR